MTKKVIVQEYSKSEESVAYYKHRIFRCARIRVKGKLVLDFIIRPSEKLEIELSEPLKDIHESLLVIPAETITSHNMRFSFKNRGIRMMLEGDRTTEFLLCVNLSCELVDTKGILDDAIEFNWEDDTHICWENTRCNIKKKVWKVNQENSNKVKRFREEHKQLLEELNNKYDRRKK